MLIKDGDLLEFVNKRGPIQEPIACQFFKQILSAVLYAHSLEYCHRDIKVRYFSLILLFFFFFFASRWEISSSGYSIIRVDFFSYLVYLQLENIFLHRGKPLLGDWGFATSFVPGMRVQQEFIGSPSYCAPEIWLFQPYEGACLCFSVLVSCSVALFLCFVNVFRPGERLVGTFALFEAGVA
jgi:serine/threonine protein kinase